MSTPLIDIIKKHNQNNKMRFHMPSHNGNVLNGLDAQNFDLTELDGLDNLLVSDGAIRALEDKIAGIYNVERSLLLTQGSTCGILTSLKVISNIGKNLVVLGEMHKSFWNGVLLWNLNVEVVSSVDELEKYMAKTQYISAICLTSPNYYGECKDIKRLRNIADRYKCLLFVDSAHGAHFVFSDLLPESVASYADLSVVSLHKTIASLGGGAVLNIKNKELVKETTYFRNALHSTSPSYLIMSSMDWAIEDMVINGAKYYEEIKKTISKYNGKIGKWTILNTDDFSRVVLKCDGMDADYTMKLLEDEGVWIEMCFEDMLVFIVTPYNYKMLDKAFDILKTLDTKKLDRKMVVDFVCPRGKLEGKLSFVQIDEALGKTSASEIGIYPPGIPAIKAGDIITKEAIKFIKENINYIFGLVNNTVAVIQ